MCNLFFLLYLGANYGYAVVRFLLDLWWFMKILNLKTNNIFNLPKEEAKRLLEEHPEEFSKNSKPKKLKNESVVLKSSVVKDSILPQIIE